MSCPTGDFDIGATRPILMSLAKGDGVDVGEELADGEEEGVCDGEGEGEVDGWIVNCQAATAAATIIIITASAASIFFCILMSSL
jgi:hypothetical protein